VLILLLAYTCRRRNTTHCNQKCAISWQ